MKTIQGDKYRPYPVVELPDRSWPERTIRRAPIWCSVDLRDGNQALSTPMGPETKLRFFQLLVEVGFKEIEIGFPAASREEYAFIRRLIEERRIPGDVTVQVLTPAREPLIRRTFEALAGVERAIVHLYNSTSVAQRELVFRMGTGEIRDLAVGGARVMNELRKDFGARIRFEYSPESFTATEPEFALEVCHAVMDVWEPSPDEPVILNLPATVEMSTPNVYADRIEWFCRRIRDRDSALVSAHTHNDRGTAVAAAELALMAGADRVEGTLFGNGERTGNLDIVAMALNLYSQGVDPGLDFCEIDRVRDVYRACTGMEVHPRHPYAGDLVYTAFSGTHQDAISKAMKAWRERGGLWQVPYLPIDPRDVGRTYESVIRINSQSGKGGAAWILEQESGLVLPKAMHPEFGRIVQALSERDGRELSPAGLLAAFRDEYLSRTDPYDLESCSTWAEGDSDTPRERRGTRLSARLRVHGEPVLVDGSGNGPLDAFVDALSSRLGIAVGVSSYCEHALERGSASRAAAFVGIAGPGGREVFGVGIDENIALAAIQALISALNRRAAFFDTTG